MAVRSKVLICDAYAQVREVLAETLRREHDVVWAATGDTCIGAVEAERPDVVVLGLRLTGASGLDVVSAIRQDAVSRETKIVVLTGSPGADERELVLAAGADRHMTKLEGPFELASVIDELLIDRDPGVEAAARNEVLFRRANERIERLVRTLREPPPAETLLAFSCECGRGDCADEIRLTHAEYLEVRRSKLRFAIRHGHEVSDAEAVVGANERYAVVEKRHPTAIRVAEETAE